MTEQEKQPWVAKMQARRAAALALREQDPLVPGHAGSVEPGGSVEDAAALVAASARSERAEAGAEREADDAGLGGARPEARRRAQLPQHAVLDADAFFAGLAVEDVPGDFVAVNRGPVLVLWVAVVSKACGHTWSEGLSFGRCLANAFAQRKGVRLGLLEGDEESLRKDLATFPRAAPVEVLGRRIPAVKVEGHWVAISGGHPVEPLTVLAQLRNSFQSHLGAVTLAMRELATAVPNPMQLHEQAYALYTQFRPSVAADAAGWGQRGELNLALLRRMAQQVLEQQP
jgi:hypothetical protein